MDLASLPLYSSYDRLMVTFSELRTYVGVNLEIYQSGTEVLKKWDICSNNWDKSFLLVILSNTQPTRSPCCLKIACSLGFLWGDWFSLSIRRAGNVDGLNFARGIHYLYTNACMYVIQKRLPSHDHKKSMVGGLPDPWRDLLQLEI